MVNLRRVLPVIFCLLAGFPGEGVWAGETPAEAPPTVTVEERLAHLEKELADSQKAQAAATSLVKSGLGVQLTGYIKFDMAYDNARTDNGNFARWVDAQAVNSKDDEFNATINQTRLGVKFFETAPGAIKSSAMFEVDLYGNGTAENKPEPMIRHAYLQVDFADAGFAVIAGQTADLISPLAPTTINYTAMWWNGNIGYRRPQLRGTQTLSAGGSGAKVVLAAALTRNIGHDNGVLDPGCTGEDSGLPGFQWRVGVAAPLFAQQSLVLGISGHWSREEWDLNTTDYHYNRISSSINLDLTLPLSDWLTVKAEGFMGRNLDAMLGGIGQGINTTTTDEIHGRGFWAALSIKPVTAPWSSWDFNAGIGIDNPDDRDLSAGQRSRNFTVFANLSCDFGHGVSSGIEYMHLETDYLGSTPVAVANRVQVAVIYKIG